MRAASLLIVLMLFAFQPAFAFARTDDSVYLKLLEDLNTEIMLDTLSDLASDRFEGRLSGTRPAELASDYISAQFNSIGLRPAGENGSYRTRFSVPLWRLIRMPKLDLVDASGSVVRMFEYRKDFAVQPGSDSRDLLTEVVFVGYGITTKDLSYDDYAQVSLEGKAALAIIGTPPGELFGKDDYASWSSKASNALKHGAAALILVDNPVKPVPNYVVRWSGGRTIYQKLAILSGTTRMAEAFVGDQGPSLLSIQGSIDRDLKPRSFPTRKQIRLSVQTNYSENATAYNVLGLLPGSDSYSKKIVIVGAHYDHLGKDVDGTIFRGANDDASGVAVLMEIARVFSRVTKPRFSILFASWCGEEEGLCGSYAYVNHPYRPLEETLAYLNLDMVGVGRQLNCQISQAHEELRSTLTESMEQLRLSVHVEGFSGGSDHASFERSRVPNLMFISWPDEVYHTPADTFDRISEERLLEASRITALLALKLVYAKVESPMISSQTSPHKTTILPVENKPEMQNAIWLQTYLMEIVLATGISLAVISVMIIYLRKKREVKPV